MRRVEQRMSSINKPGRQIDPKLLEILVCPLTKSPLVFYKDTQELVSEQAGLAFPIRNGVPIMLVDEARSLTAVLSSKTLVSDLK
jgi:uncharacterized protein YbaR (Trm112 family)